MGSDLNPCPENVLPSVIEQTI